LVRCYAISTCIVDTHILIARIPHTRLPLLPFTIHARFPVLDLRAHVVTALHTFGSHHVYAFAVLYASWTRLRGRLRCTFLRTGWTARPSRFTARCRATFILLPHCRYAPHRCVAPLFCVTLRTRLRGVAPHAHHAADVCGCRLSRCLCAESVSQSPLHTFDVLRTLHFTLRLILHSCGRCICRGFTSHLYCPHTTHTRLVYTYL